jgi:hypothetical protein
MTVALEYGRPAKDERWRVGERGKRGAHRFAGAIKKKTPLQRG